jgi:multiple sugar transport system ATP-binding protein
MKDGIIQQFDTPQTLYDFPCNLFVAGFIGSPQMNFMDATITEKNGKLYSKIGNNELLIPEAKTAALAQYVGKTVVMGVRPENFLSFDEVTADNALDAVADFYELLGADVNLYVYVNGVKAIVRMPSSRKRPASDDIQIAVDMKFAHFFDKETEQAICH